MAARVQPEASSRGSGPPDALEQIPSLAKGLSRDSQPRRELLSGRGRDPQCQEQGGDHLQEPLVLCRPSVHGSPCGSTPQGLPSMGRVLLLETAGHCRPGENLKEERKVPFHKGKTVSDVRIHL